MLLAFSQMLVQSYINQFPNEVIAGIGAASKVDSFAQIPMSAISTACTTFVGQNLGAKKYDRVQHGVIDSIRLSNIMMIVVCTIVFATAPFLISLFNKDPLVVQHGTAMLRHTIFTFILLGWSHVYNGCCRGAGNMRIPLIIAVLCQCVLRYAFVYVGLKINYSVDILYWSEAVAFGLAGLCASLYFRFSRWTKEKQLRP
jgi:Na+-driven multidrug efflux pump